MCVAQYDNSTPGDGVHAVQLEEAAGFGGGLFTIPKKPGAGWHAVEADAQFARVRWRHIVGTPVHIFGNQCAGFGLGELCFALEIQLSHAHFLLEHLDAFTEWCVGGEEGSCRKNGQQYFLHCCCSAEKPVLAQEGSILDHFCRQIGLILSHECFIIALILSHEGT